MGAVIYSGEGSASGLGTKQQQQHTKMGTTSKLVTEVKSNTAKEAEVRPALPIYTRLPSQGKVEPITGLRRTTLWKLVHEGKVRSVCLRKKGASKGTRLIVVASLLSYLESLEEPVKDAETHELVEGGEGR